MKLLLKSILFQILALPSDNRVEVFENCRLEAVGVEPTSYHDTRFNSTYAIDYLSYSQLTRTIKCKGYHQPPLSLPIETKKDIKLRY